MWETKSESVVAICEREFVSAVTLCDPVSEMEIGTVALWMGPHARLEREEAIVRRARHALVLRSVAP